MAGIYLHIPFCRQSCSYCDFYFSVNKKHEEAFFNALRAELALRRRELNLEPVETVYFGGGTPSYASPAHIERILEWLSREVPLQSGVEITLEANPDDMSPENLRRWKAMGINRLSVGVQSFEDRFLKLLRRSHDARRVEEALHEAQAAGFDNLNLDLIYGIPGMDTEDWKAQINTFLQWNIPHLSAYALTVEPGTLLDFQVKKGKIHLPPEEIYANQFFQLRRMLHEAGFYHYEISNFALPGYESRHNSSYWEGKAYYGFGPSAHSYDGEKIRRWNVSNLHRYIRGIQGEGPWYETEILTPADRYHEYVMTRLRTDKGVNKKEIARIFPDFYGDFIRTAERLRKEKKLTEKEGVYRIAPAFLFLSDGIMAEFF